LVLLHLAFFTVTLLVLAIHIAVLGLLCLWGFFCTVLPLARPLGGPGGFLQGQARAQQLRHLLQSEEGGLEPLHCLRHLRGTIPPDLRLLTTVYYFLLTTVSLNDNVDVLIPVLSLRV
jgi:hypothetical protein